MPQNDNRTPTLRDYGFGSDDEFFANPGAAIARVAEGIETRLRGEYQAEQQRVLQAQAVEDARAKLFRAAPWLKSERAEVLDYLARFVAENPEVDAINSLDEGLPILIDAATEHLKRRKIERAEEDELAAYSGGPGDEPDASEFGTPRSATSIIRERREKRRARRGM